MQITALEASEFIIQVSENKLPVFDARSESEFEHAHIPTALNLPILNNEERKEVGTLFKNKGNEAAVHAGFKLVGPRFHEIITKAKELAPGKEVLLYCWRGGMRSQIMSWLLSMNGFKVVVLKGGYKTFRSWTLSSINKPLKPIILGGLTGSGKTELLELIEKQGGHILNLEELANHKGSAFGSLGKGAQPSNEQFENRIAMKWNTFDTAQPVWIENESRSIGSCMLPVTIYNMIRNSEIIEINVGDERRKKRILSEYGIFPTPVLAATTEKIAKRLGPQHLKQALQLLDAGDLNGWLEIVLAYYDKLYAYGSLQRAKDKCYQFDLEYTDEKDFAELIINYSNQIFSHQTLKEEL